MTKFSVRSRSRSLLIAGATVAALAAGGTSAAVAAAAHPAASHTVIVTCVGHATTRPKALTLACADGNASIFAAHWAAWRTTEAFGSATYEINDCVPYCAAGHRHKFPVLVAAWRARALPGHAGESYFSRLTLILSGNRSYQAGGQTYRLPATITIPLAANGGI